MFTPPPPDARISGYMRLMIHHRTIPLLLIALLPAMAATVGSQHPSGGEAARAKELIARARAAIGGEAVISRIQTITASARYRRFIKYLSVQSPTKVVEKERTLSGKMKFEFALPDKFRRRVTGETLRGFGYSFAQIINGDKAWRDPPLRPISSQSDRRVIDVDDVERTEFLQATGAKQELTYYSMGWLLQPLPAYPLETTYVGMIQTGAIREHAIIAQGQSGFRIFVLLDANSRLPAAITISFVEDIQQTVLVESAGFFDRRFMQETFARARAERRARANQPKPYEMTMRFSDHRLVDGINLPHRVTTTLNGQVIEDLTISDFEINRPINPKRFAGPPEQRD